MKETVMTNCPNCSSNDITLDIENEKLKCNHCGSFIKEKKYRESTDAINNLNEKKIKLGASSIDNEKVNIVSLQCPNCNSEYITGENNEYPVCPWCIKKFI